MRLSPNSRVDPNSARHIHPAIWPQWPFDEPPKVRERVETIKRVAKGCRIHNTLTRPPRIDVDLRVADGQSE